MHQGNISKYLIFSCSLLVSLVSCKKDETAKPHSYVFARFENSDEYGHMDKVSATLSGGVARIAAEGPLLEQFALCLPAIKDTGNYPALGIGNICYSDGNGFYPDHYSTGYVHISYLDSATVIGDFKVTLSDTHAEVCEKTIVGGFGINVP